MQTRSSSLIRCLVLGVFVVAVSTIALRAQVPQTISYQGVLLNQFGLPIGDGVHSLTLHIYKNASGTTPIYTEVQSSVAVKKGLFSIAIGSVTPLLLPFDAPYYLGIGVDGAQELTPPTPFTSAPYALGLSLPFAGTSADPDHSMKVTNSADGSAIIALHSSESGSSPTILAQINSADPDGTAILGEATGKTPTGHNAGVMGWNDAQNDQGDGVYGAHAGAGFGVNGESVHGTGVHGASAFSNGVWVFGQSSTGVGVFGQGYNGIGVLAQSATGGNALVVNWAGALGGTDPSINNIAVFSNTTNGRVARIDNFGVFHGPQTVTSGADVAEALEVEGARSNYFPGDVLVLSTAIPGSVSMCSVPYSPLVAGVYATKPGVVLTPVDDSTSWLRVPMGVVGIIPTKVVPENGPIEIGDLLVTSSLPGCAMRGDPAKVHSGNVLGKAMERFVGSGTGMIKVLVGAR